MNLSPVGWCFETGQPLWIISGLINLIPKTALIREERLPFIILMPHTFGGALKSALAKLSTVLN